MLWWHAVILGLVEGITEYLPVSSTGHLILTAGLLGLGGDDSQTAVNAFNIIIQGGAILAVLGLYRPRVIQMIKGLVGRDPAGLRLAINIIVAFLPAAVLGVLLDEWLELRLFHPIPVCGALVVGGVYMLIVDRLFVKPKREADGNGSIAGGEIEDLTPVKSLVIGLLQCVAMWPGTSRSMMTITGGVFAGLRPAAAAEFSFLLGLPTLGGATVYKLYRNVSNAQENGDQNMFEMLGIMPTLIGLAVATVSAALAVKWLVSFLTRHGLGVFGWYRIVIGILLLIVLQAGWIVWPGG